MSGRSNLTLGICLAAGLAFGIGLARPGQADAPSATAASSGYDQAEAAPAEAAAAAVEIAGFAFSASSPVAPGATITVLNNDGVTHTLTAGDGSFDTGSISGGSSTAFSAPATPGTYSFFCAIHPSMTGTLTVIA